MAETAPICPEALDYMNAAPQSPVLFEEYSWYGLDLGVFSEVSSAADPALLQAGNETMMLPPIVALPPGMEIFAPPAPTPAFSSKPKQLKDFMYSAPDIKYQSGLCTVKACLRQRNSHFRRCDTHRLRISQAKKNERHAKTK